jgi:hypothetical protein
MYTKHSKIVARKKSRFLKKAAQKLSGIRVGGAGPPNAPDPDKKSFLLLFYKKAVLPNSNHKFLRIVT